MLFNSYTFLLLFLPSAIAIYRIADDYPRSRIWVLIALSLVFYGYWDVRFVPLMLGSILFNWLASRVYAARKSPIIITAAIVANLAVLGLFKYANFFEENVSLLLGSHFAPLHLALPLGISFFTFHHIMYLVDLRRNRAPLYPLAHYALYICFFPQAIAGPIARWNEVMDQFGRQVFRPGWEKSCVLGVTFIVLGLIQKVVIADPLRDATDPIYAHALIGPLPAGDAWMALAFAFQIFFDFAGYSDIAIGLGLIFGIELPENFNGPFRCTSILQFWQSWHMTLARFLRDYVFTPLSRLRIGGPRHRANRLLFALLATMALCGLWHGAAWHYMIWGTLQGLALAVAATWRRYGPPLMPLIGWALTISFFVVTSVFFRAESFAAIWHIYQGLAVAPRFFSADGRRTLEIALVVAIALPPSQDIARWLSERPYGINAYAMALAAILILAMIGREETHEFVYFQF
ncbi:MAG TPA: MBOAT family O-acyltransferase [Xanthobacteraceae bacterium]|nr:MBOAT family O-acyltransferase [Xanthobacteraceae bacterium]